MTATGITPRPWRSARLGWAVTALVLIAGVPLFLCMPPWTDTTLYDVAARNILRGGVHYRDVFDTNLPGMVWLTAAIRSISGWSYEALRIWDLLIVGATSIVLLIWLKQAGATSAVSAWFAAAVALFYFSTSEFNHCQRDPWMLLPAAIASRMRLDQILRERISVRHSIVEGFLWGLAVWLKPHVLITAAVVWITSALLMRRQRLRDGTAVLCGGLLCGLPAIIWLIASGTWPYFWDVFTRWNPEYFREGVWEAIPQKFLYLFWCFQPWGLLHVVALPLAAWSLGVCFLGGRGSCRIERNGSAGASLSQKPIARALLAALYLGWIVQAVVLQKGFDYVQVPAMFLAMALLASRGWSVGFSFLAWYASLALACLVPAIPTALSRFNEASPYLQIERHPISNPRIVGLWPRCWREGSSPELRDRLGHFTHVHCETNWEDLDAVATFLRSVEPPLRDRELTCWHDSTHPLYLMLDVDPSTRFMHFGTVFPLRGKLDEIRAEVVKCPQRHVVSDLRRMTYDLGKAYSPGEFGPNSLPAWFPKSQRSAFPWNQPIVFRSGRYVVHRIERPPMPEEIDIPDWSKLGG